MGTGYYKQRWQDEAVRTAGVDQLARRMLDDIERGVDDTGIRAGVIGELGMSRPRTDFEERVLRAAARVQRRTGVAINVHFDIGGPLDERLSALEVLLAEGADASRVAFSHFYPRLDQMAQLQAIAARGAYVEFDLFGQESWASTRQVPALEEQLAAIRACFDAGMGERILLSQDVCHRRQLVANGGSGYGYVIGPLASALQSAGLSQAQLETVMVENPRRLLAVNRAPE
jgi:phosphotriesterase-related protein